MISRPRTPRPLLAALTIVALGVVALPAQADDRVGTSIDRTIGTDREVAVALTCPAPSTCAGSLTLRLSTGGTKTVRYQVTAGRTRTVTWTLPTARYRALTRAGQARLRVAVKPTRGNTAHFTTSAVIRPASPRVSVTGSSFAVADDGLLTLPFACAAARCAGRLNLTAAGTPLSTRFSAARGAHSAQLTLPPATLAALGTTPTEHRLVIVESTPNRVTSTLTVSLTHSTTPTEPPVRGDSDAYANRNWTPTAYDTCPAALHKTYAVIGPDGKRYPTWHPAQVTDPATGMQCTFGHEHGADPSTSDIYDWVADFYAPDDLVAHETTGLPFGYASEALDHYAHEHGMSMRHEDNSGHKVFVANNVTMLDADKNYLTTTDSSGASVRVTCDVLIKLHQGSWSPDATSNNAHEMFFAARCNDGTEVISTDLARFGHANELHSTCEPEIPIATVGSTLPHGTGGKRIIPTTGCVNQYATGATANLWALYEVWMSDVQLTTKTGDVLASFDPWFAVRNPSRYYDPASSTATTNGVLRPLDLAWSASNPATSFPWSQVNGLAPFDWRDPRSPFDGAQRDFYLNQLKLHPTGTEGASCSPTRTAARPPTPRSTAPFAS